MIQEADDLQTVLALVAGGVGTALVPAGGRSIAPPTVRLIPLQEPEASWRIGVVWRPDSPIAARFVAGLG